MVYCKKSKPEDGITADKYYSVVETKHQSNNSICVINDFGIHMRVPRKYFDFKLNNYKTNIDNNRNDMVECW